jgi:subtilisin family serine protease
LKTFLLAAAAVLGLTIVGSGAARTEQSAATERVLVGFTKTPGASERAAVARLGGEVLRDLSNVNAFAVSVPAAAMNGLAHNPNVQYVEPDETRNALLLADEELDPALDNGLYGLVTTNAEDVQARGRFGAGIKACVADSGVAYEHPDLVDRYKGGIDFAAQRVDNDPTWGGDVHETHGTHVAGIVLGTRGNGQGIFGAAPGADLYYARVLAYNPRTGLVQGSSSDVMAGVRWLVEQQGCNIVNLSLGGGRFSRTEDRFYADMDAKGALIVAATGNDSAAAISYPAGYESVVSVGAVDVNNAHAAFSNTGAGLDLSAPGVLVLSSVPRDTGSEASVTARATERAFGMEFAGFTSTTGVTAQLVDCGLGQAGECPASVSGNIALIQRGAITFGEKVTNAQAAGAIAAIIYNNRPGDFLGTLGVAGTWIPAVSVSDVTGATLVKQVGNTATVVNVASSWGYKDGTSMATPHVSGIAALVWSVNPSMTDEQVEEHLKTTARDLGAAGYDTTFGYGLVDARAAVRRAGG